MDYVGRIGSLITSLNNFYNEINPATLSGAIDIIVVEQENGELASSPFHVRFGKLSVLLPQEKKVEISVNGTQVPYLMKVGEAGEAFFVFETDHEVPEEFQTSPILQALAENRSDVEEPPFLDISEHKDGKDTSEQTKDSFDDDECKNDNDAAIPAELQSPKMIIEEQMDKVVTKMDSLQHNDYADHPKPENNLYAMDDGSTLLERVAPEAITTTTIAKERFIVRPVENNLNSLWMDVTHTVDEDFASPSENPAKKPNDSSGEKESIVLDISGYKTEQKGQEADKSHGDDAAGTKGVPTEPSDPAVDNKSWGWGMSYADDSNKNDNDNGNGNGNGNGNDDDGDGDDKVNETKDDSKDQNENENETVKLKSGRTYRIEMSLCGFSAFGYDQNENALLFNDQQVSYDAFVRNPSILNDPRLVFRYRNHYFAAVKNSPLFTSLLIFKKPLEKQDASNDKVSDSSDSYSYSYGRGWRQWLSRTSSAEPLPTLGRESEPGKEGGGNAYDAGFSGERTTFTTTTKTTSVGWSPDHTHDSGPFFAQRKNYAKTLRLTSEQLKNLNLKKGVNTISFSVSSAYQGTATCVAKVFFWDHDIQVVISDIDGTITKSDTMGHLMTMIGKDWTHPGVAQLYTDIANNGYHFMYLTSRAIGQADYTRDYLKKVLQGNYQLPDGPVIMSPDRLFTSLHREVIIRKPEMFKMACLRDIQRLFGGRDPFYAGFGNRITDAISYRSVSVPSSRIFTIDAQGNVKLELVIGFKSSYVHLNDLVDQIFPPIDNSIQEEYSDYNFWKPPMPDIEIPELEEEGPLPTSPKPKPIKPDPTSLPKESVVAFEPEPKRGILRSFTSRASSSTTTSKKAAPVKKSLSPPAKKLSSHSSAPDLTAEAVQVAQDDADSIHLASPRSLPDDYKPSEIEHDNDITCTAPTTRARSSSGIMSKVINGVFSRRSPSNSELNVTNSPVKKDELEEGEGEQQEHKLADDDLLESEIDDLDLDTIPFI
ncbi:Lipin/Ned1/Smp2-domain-containing protein [Parasitella parasitica]|nr:Lipin/Ned1/Smp2-domain-containing protein [Parasitella parasitica]